MRYSTTNQSITAVAHFVQKTLLTIPVRSYITGSLAFLSTPLERKCHDVDLVIPLDMYADVDTLVRIVDILKAHETRLDKRSPMMLDYDSACVISDYHEWVEQEGSHHPLEFGINNVEINLFFDPEVDITSSHGSSDMMALSIHAAMKHKEKLNRGKDLRDITVYHQML